VFQANLISGLGIYKLMKLHKPGNRSSQNEDLKDGCVGLNGKIPLGYSYNKCEFIVGRVHLLDGIDSLV
jgi:hypothetical protein